MTLASITAVTLFLAAGFAALYLTGLENQRPADTYPVGEETQTEVPNQAGPTPDTEELISLRQENADLMKQLDALRAELESMREKESAADTEHLPVPPTNPPDQFDPDDLKPADPESLTYTFVLNEILSRIAALEDKIQSGPYIVAPDGTLMRLEDVVLEEGTEIILRPAQGAVLHPDGTVSETEIDYEAMGYRYPTIAISYRDMVRGTTYSCNGDQRLFSASLIKAPYVYTLLHQIAQYNEIKRANPENDPAVGKTLAQETWDKYDLGRMILLTEESKAPGSGKIKNMDLSGEGKEFSVLELIEYAIKHSDNTAFRVLRDEFGYEYFWTVSYELGVRSVFTSFNQLTANEANLYLAAIYDFALEYPEEGGMLVNLMKKSDHQVLIPMAVKNPGDAAHKYGWDSESYHDMAIVYGDAPYAVTVMTTFDIATNHDGLNAYIRSLIREIEALHETLYRVYREME